MSSHHIVREQQEPALYIHALGNFDQELLGQLLEWSPTVIVQEESYEQVASMGIKIDVVAGGTPAAHKQEHTSQMIQYGKAIQPVIKYLLEKGHRAVNIVAEGDGYVEIEKSFEEINLVWFNETGKTIRIKSGFKLWKPAGTVYGLQATKDVTTSNLKPIRNGIYEVEKDGFISFNFDAPFLFITEHL